MNPITHVVCFAVRQTCGVCVKDVAAEVEKYYRDHSAALPRAIERATEQAWRALAVALAGDGWADRVKLAVTASGDEKAFREQVKKFLADGPLNLAGREPERFRRDCLTELTTLRRDRALLAAPPADAVARTVADFSRFDAPAELVGEAGRAATGVADALAPQFPNLSKLLRTPPPLLAVAFAYFFRKAVAADDELFDAIQHDAIQALTASQLAGFQNLDKALKNLGDGFDTALDQAVVFLAERIEAARRAAEAAERQARLAAEQAKHAATAAAGAERAARDTGEKVQRLTTEVLDLRAVLANLPTAGFPDGDVIRRLVEEVIRRELKAGMNDGSLRPQDAVSIRGDDERRAIRQLLDRYRQLPEEERRRVPAVLNGLGKLLHGAGDWPEARRAFAEVAELVPDAAARAEVLINEYRTALEQQRYDEALVTLRQAVALDPRRAPFPMERFDPVGILGAGGFGTVFRCQDRNFRGREVAVKALHADDLDRGIDEVFAEAHALLDFTDPAVIRLWDAEFTDRATKRGPYFVMEYFRGVTLADYVRKPGPIPPADLLSLARQVATGLARVHHLDILHRDLKPDNVLVRRDAEGWQVRVIDFGLAIRRDQMDTQAKASSTEKSLHHASVVGTLKFAAPEQMGELPDVRVDTYSDVYGFGRTCYAALFGHPDPDDEDKASLPEGWRQLLSRCTAKRPERRPQGFEEVLEQLERIAGIREGTPTLPSPADGQPDPPAPPSPAATRGREAPPSEADPVGQAHPPAADTGDPPRPPALPVTTGGDHDPLERAKVLLNEGDYTAAMTECDHVLERDARNAEAYLVRGEAGLRAWERWRGEGGPGRPACPRTLGGVDWAFSDATTALDLCAGSVPALLLRVRAEIKQSVYFGSHNESEQAASDLAEVITRDPAAVEQLFQADEMLRTFITKVYDDLLRRWLGEGNHDRVVVGSEHLLRLWAGAGLKTDTRRVRLIRAKSYAAKGDWKNALADAAAVAAEAQGDRWRRGTKEVVEAWLIEATVRLEQRKFDLALAALKLVRQEAFYRPVDPEVLTRTTALEREIEERKAESP